MTPIMDKNYTLIFSYKLHNKDVTGEPYVHIGIDWYNEWPVLRICKSTETKEVIKFLESFNNLS